MPKLMELVDSKGRVNYDKLRDYVMNCSLPDFTEESQHPFLVGKELYDGEIRRKIGASSSTSTLMFDAADIKETALNALRSRIASEDTLLEGEENAGSSSVSRAIYILKKKLYCAVEEQNIIKIGRASDNDIVIADFVISKYHAQIVIFHGMYFIVDLNSTNGTKVNKNPVSPKMKVQLQVNSSIDFGRFSFVFTHPLQVYRGLRKEALGM